MAKLYKGNAATDVSNARSSGVLTVPYQPVRAGAKVVGSKKGRKAPKSGQFKLSLKGKK